MRAFPWQTHEAVSKTERPLKRIQRFRLSGMTRPISSAKKKTPIFELGAGGLWIFRARKVQPTFSSQHVEIVDGVAAQHVFHLAFIPTPKRFPNRLTALPYSLSFSTFVPQMTMGFPVASRIKRNARKEAEAIAARIEISLEDLPFQIAKEKALSESSDNADLMVEHRRFELLASTMRM